MSSVAASRYAKALMDVLYPDKADAGLQQLRQFASVLAEQPDAQRVFENPTISGEGRKGLMKTIADALAFDAVVRNFLNLLVERNRLGLITEVVAAYEKLLDEKQGVVRALVTSAHPLDAAQQKEVAAKLETLTGKQVRVELSVDPSLIGGLVAQVGSTVYDGSIRQQLTAFKNRLIQD